MLDDSELDLPESSGQEPPRRRGNRFPVIAGTLGAILLLALIGIVVYALVILPGQQAAVQEPSTIELTASALAQLQASNTATSSRTPTSTPTRTNTPRPTNTPLITGTFDPATQTVNALLTQAAVAQTQAVTVTATGPTSTPGTPTATPSALPQSGFAEEIGAPGLLAAAAILLAIVIAARRLRNAD
jgi:cytoskeletal protein RodZ